jgi:hypothetical protein
VPVRRSSSTMSILMGAGTLTKADRGELELDYGAAGTRRMRVISEGTPKRFGGPQ